MAIVDIVALFKYLKKNYIYKTYVMFEQTSGINMNNDLSFYCLSDFGFTSFHNFKEQKDVLGD